MATYTTITPQTDFLIQDVLGSHTFPRPELRDTREIRRTRINRLTRGLTRRMYTDDDWHHLEIHSYEFRNLTEAKKDEMVALIDRNVGSPVLTRDYVGKVRTSYIEETSPVIEVRGDQCSYSVGIVMRTVLT